jgi:hypothetical protein
MNARETTTCINCGGQSAYNRRVEDVDTGRVLGSLCVSCERARFGDALRESEATDSPHCLYCETRATYALPEHVVSLDDDDVSECEVTGYFVTAETPRLCRAHLDALDREPATAGEPVTSDVGD